MKAIGGKETMKFRKKIVRRVKDAGAEPKPYAEQVMAEVEKEPKMQDDPHLNRGCRGCLWAMSVFFLAFIASLAFGKCIR